MARNRAVLVGALAALVGCQTPINKTGEALPSGCEPLAPFPLSLGGGGAGEQCEYGSISVPDRNNCVIVGVSANGAGGTAVPQLSTVQISKDGTSDTRSPTSTTSGWSATSMAFNCSTLGCANGQYQVIIHTPNGEDCLTFGTVSLDVKVR